MDDVIKLPEVEEVEEEEGVEAEKRRRGSRGSRGKRWLKRMGLPRPDPQQEAVKRRRNVDSLAVLGQEDASVKLLEDLVFGAEDELLGRLEEEEDKDVKSGTLLEEDDDDDDDSGTEVENRSRLALQSAQKAAWVDEDDELEEEVDMSHRFRKALMKGEAELTMTKQKLQQRMKEQFQKAMGGTPSWAEVKVKDRRNKKGDDSDDDDEDDLCRRTGNFVTSSKSLPSSILRIEKCPNANTSCLAEGRLTTVQFHPSAQVVMTAGLDHTISLFQVDGKDNPKIQSIHLQRFPVHKAQFSVDGERVVATGVKSKMFYIYDMMAGRVIPVNAVRGLKQTSVREFCVSPEGDSLLLSGGQGYMHVLKLKTTEVVRSMKINGSVTGMAFSPDGSEVFTQSEEGVVYVWDVRSSRCVNKFEDDGCIRGTSIAASRNGQYLACGSQSGVVNVYSQKDCLSSTSPRPLKAVMNLVTPVTSLAFNHNSELLGIASDAEDEAVRLLHLPSLSVFSNFPMFKRKVLKRAHCMDFSPHSGFFSLANSTGHAPLFRLLHYKDF